MLPVLSAHNYYRNPGGEDIVFRAEVELLQSHGHSVSVFEEHNEHIRSGAHAALEAIWNPGAGRRVGRLASHAHAAVAHFHNTFPRISPAAYSAATASGAAVVQTLHNFRLICPGAVLARSGKPCEDCLQERSFRPALRHACYRNSRTATAGVVSMLTAHRWAGTYQHQVDANIALSEFARSKFVDGGLPAERIFVKPNFVAPDPGAGDGSGGFALFAGRLAQEKGIPVLLRAWQVLADVPLRIAGDGPLAAEVQNSPQHMLGPQPRPAVLELLKRATVLVFPSTCYEGDPMILLEAFACGTPVIASRLGSMAERIRDGETGLLFNPGDAADLAAKVRYAFSHPEHLARMRVNARREFEAKYTAERNYQMLLGIYEHAIENARRRRRRAS